MIPPLSLVPQAGVTGLHQAFLAAARAAPDHPAIVFQGQTLSYGQLVSLTKNCRAQLQSWGVRPGDRVAALGLGHPLQLAALLAMAELGAIWVPLNFRLAQAEWRQIIDDCQPVCLLADETWWAGAQELAQQAGLACHRLSDLGPPGDGPVLAGGPNRKLQPDQSDEPVLLVYTSGTTGRPKGALHSQGNLLANARAAILAQGITPADRVLTLLPLFHVGGLCIQTLPALLAGASVLLQPKFDPRQTLDDLANAGITLTLMVPAVMKAVIDQPDFQTACWPRLRALWAGSSTLPDEWVLAWLRRGVPVCNVYGATETGPFSIALGHTHASSHLGSCGWPAQGVEARIEPLAGGIDGVGEVWLRGPAVVRRYWPNQAALDADGWFHTGDLARMAADQSWRIVGRVKDMIISGGENIYPAEIENILARHPAVAECAAIGLPDPRWGESVVAVVVLHPAAQVSDDELLADVRASLARYKHPRQLMRLDHLPKTALGKVQKDRLILRLTQTSDTAARPWANLP